MEGGGTKAGRGPAGYMAEGSFWGGAGHRAMAHMLLSVVVLRYGHAAAAFQCGGGRAEQ